MFSKAAKYINTVYSRLNFSTLFVGLSLILLIFLILLYISFITIMKDISKSYLDSTLSFAYDLSYNFEKDILNKVGDKNLFTKLKQNPKLKKELETKLSLLASKKIEYIYLLEEYQKNRYRFLLDGSKYDKAEFGEPYIPDKDYQVKKPKHFFHTKSSTLWLTYIYPLKTDPKTVLVVDFSMKDYTEIQNALFKFKKAFTYIIFFLFSVIITLLIFAYFDRKREKEKKEAFKMLEELNKTLKIRVQKAIEEIRQKDLMLFEQAKLSQMGEMVNMIAHQWRQPLNAISASAIKLNLKASMDMLDKNTIIETATFIEKVTQQMSTTIDNFLNFAKRRTQKEHFKISELIKDIKELVQTQLQNNNINLNIKIKEDFKLYANKHDIEHILLVLISNAKDALEDCEKKEINILIDKDKTKYNILVEDSGPGISKELRYRIFEPYFTTKEQGKGTGIGLYMAKRIAKEHLRGDLVVKESKKGALFYLWFPLNQKESE